jgi:hypothetical protein
LRGFPRGAVFGFFGFKRGLPFSETLALSANLGAKRAFLFDE